MAKTKGARGLGNIRQLKSGRFQVRFTDPQGISRTAGKTFAKEIDAEKALIDILSAINKGTWQMVSTTESDVDLKTITLDQLASRWRSQAVNAQGRPLGDKTLAEYERLISRTLASFKDQPIRKITTQQIENWRIREISRGVLNQTSKAYKHLKQLMTWAQKRNWILMNPCTIERAGTYKAEQPGIPTQEQVELMLHLASEPLKTILAIASEGGLRKGEILELRRKDIDLKPLKGRKEVSIRVSKSVLWVNGQPKVKAPKSVKGIRSVLLPERASELLRAHLRKIDLGSEALLFGRAGDPGEHMGQFQLRVLWDKVSDLVGYSGTFHSLRGYHLTQYALLGATTKELQDRAGHSTPQMVMVYQHNVGREADLVSRLGSKVAS
jgi:integrase